MKAELQQLFMNEIRKSVDDIDAKDFAFTIDTPKSSDHGDLASNIAMQLAKLMKRNPREIATMLANTITHPDIERIEVAGPGFINIFFKNEALHRWLGALLRSNEPLQSSMGKGVKVLVEFVSANPTGPLHVGHGRGAALGDSVASILEAVGYKVSREYYVNDAGNQMLNLAGSIYARYTESFAADGIAAYPFPKDGYKGDYIYTIAEEIKNSHTNTLLTMTTEEALAICKQAGIKSILDSIDATLKRFNVKIDKYFSEESLYRSGELNRALSTLTSKGATYEKEGAIWLSTEKLGDEKDRVLKKSDGTYTYLTPDIAYHKNKYDRGFDLLIDLWGADHHGYTKRLSSALELLGYNPKCFDVILVQMVGLLEGGEKKVMSTRAGEFVTLDWLIDEVGVDAARFFYNMRSSDSQFEFDIDLAKTRTSDNPVYYVQYAHARVCSLFATAATRGITPTIGADLDKLELPSERELIKSMMEFRYVLELAAKYNEPHRLVYYLQELAGQFHAYYYNTNIVGPEIEQTNARLSLCSGVGKTIKYGLQLLGVSAPEKM
jgi:arginyl-tRNA synthetase